MVASLDLGCKTRPSKKWETAHDNGWNVSFGADTSVVRTGLLNLCGVLEGTCGVDQLDLGTLACL